MYIARFTRRALGIGAYTTGAVTGWPYARFLGLRDAAERALDGGDVKDADLLASELLELAERYRGDWNYGNAFHHGHHIRGLCALRSGRQSEAEEHLRVAGRCPGSPQLNSFGPNMRLAAELLEAGAREAVLQYLEDCKAFWQVEVKGRDGKVYSGAARLDEWAAEIRDGKPPDFGANLEY
jgi:hypothetical protein